MIYCCQYCYSVLYIDITVYTTLETFLGETRNYTVVLTNEVCILHAKRLLQAGHVSGRAFAGQRIAAACGNLGRLWGSDCVVGVLFFRVLQTRWFGCTTACFFCFKWKIFDCFIVTLGTKIVKTIGWQQSEYSIRTLCAFSFLQSIAS